MQRNEIDINYYGLLWKKRHAVVSPSQFQPNV